MPKKSKKAIKPKLSVRKKNTRGHAKRSSAIPLKGAIFSLAFDPFFGGAEVAVKEIATRLRNFSFKCFTNLFDKKWPTSEAINNIEVIRVGKGSAGGDYYGRPLQKILYVWRAWRAAEKAHKSEKFDFIWAVMASYAGVAALIFKLNHPKVPMILTLQEGDSETHILKRVGIFYPLWRKIFTHSDHIQTISSYLKDFAERHSGRKVSPITIIPNGVDIAAIESAITENKKLKKGKIKEKRCFTIITTSRLVHKNGLDTLIYAAAELKKYSAPTFAVHIVGDGPDAKQLYKLAKQLNVLENIDFVGGVAPDDIPVFLADADVFVRPSRSEGLGNSFLEAMAAGLPIIGTPVGGIPDFLRDPHIFGITKSNGLFAVPNHPADLAAKILLIMRNKQMRISMAKNGKALIKRDYSWDGISAKMGDIFTKLCGY